MTILLEVGAFEVLLNVSAQLTLCWKRPHRRLVTLNAGLVSKEIPQEYPFIQVYVMNRYELVVVQISKGGACFGIFPKVFSIV